MKSISHPAKVRNLWHRKDSPYSQPEYQLTGEPLFEHRGVLGFRDHGNSCLFVLGDAAIAHRAGAGNATQAIDELLDGEAPCDDRVAEHLKAHGFSPLTYAQYMKDWAAGRRA